MGLLVRISEGADAPRDEIKHWCHKRGNLQRLKRGQPYPAGRYGGQSCQTLYGYSQRRFSDLPTPHQEANRDDSHLPREAKPPLARGFTGGSLPIQSDFSSGKYRHTTPIRIMSFTYSISKRIYGINGVGDSEEESRHKRNAQG